jgi:hypothetical protein
MAELIAASREGDEVEAKILLDHGADVFARGCIVVGSRSHLAVDSTFSSRGLRRA